MTLELDRRHLLTGAAAATGGLLLTACGGSDNSGTAAPAASDPSSAASSAAAPSASSSAAGGGDALATLADIAQGKAVAAKTSGGDPILIARTGANTVKAFSAICPHQGCTVAPGPSSLDCPCHGSKFETATGKVLNGPAASDLKTVAVKVEGGKVVEG